ncbi:MFS transporter [Streptomyces natalensis]|uniref:MFS transporter n=1 Tax=Streptomyces natalensis TaxID=68242 RepID=UPI001F51AE92|nr:MFS transporter [Streptomyces natalensis]
MSLLIVGVDNTIVTIALPNMRTDLHTSFVASQWTVDAYQLVLGAFLLMAGSTADRWGRRRTLQTGLGLFTVASLLCSLAPTVGWLIAFRVLQALGGSMMNPVAMAIVAQVYPDPAKRAKAFGVWSGVYGLSMAIGPILGGFLVAGPGWRSIFWINIPIGVLAIVLCARFVPESKAPYPRNPDPVGQGLVVLMLLSLTYAIIEGRSLGWGSITVVTLTVVAAASAGLLLRWELRRQEPLIDPRFFASAPFSGGVVMALVGMAAAGGYLWVMTFYLQYARTMPPSQAGMFLLPVAVMVLVIAPLSGRLAAHRGPRIPLMISGAGIAAGAAVLVGLQPSSPTWTLIVSFVLFGLGFGMLNAPVTTISVSGMPPAQSAVASAVASTGRQVGQALGVAIIGAIVVPGINGHAIPASLAAASHPGWWTIGLGGLLVIVVAAVTTTPAAVRSARRVAIQFAGTNAPTDQRPRPVTRA